MSESTENLEQTLKDKLRAVNNSQPFPRKRLALYIVVAILAIGSVILGTSLYFGRGAAQDAAIPVAEKAVQDRQQQIIQQQLSDQGKALQELQQKNDERVKNGVPPILTPAPSSDALVNAVTTKVLAALPPTGSTPSGDTIQRIVSQTLSQIPINPGTTQYVMSLVNSILGSNPNLKGPGPTDLQIQTAVNAYISKNPPAPGVGIRSISSDSDSHGDTIVTVTLTDGTKSTFTVLKGSTGATGPTGPTGAMGSPGRGIAHTQQDSDNCYRDVTFTDGSTERWGPFCPTPTNPPTTTVTQTTTVTSKSTTPVPSMGTVTGN